MNIKKIKISSILLLLSTILANSNEVKFTPYLSTYFSSNGSIYNSTLSTFSLLNKLGLKASKNVGNIDITGDFSFYSTKNVDNNLLSMNPNLSLINSRGYKNSNDLWFINSDFKISYTTNNFTLYFGKISDSWGYGNSSLLISNNTPSFPKFGFTWFLNQKISLEYFYGSLVSLLPDSSFQNLYSNNIGERIAYVNRSIAAHRLTFKLHNNVHFKASESVIFSRKTLDINYLIPFLPYWALQSYNGDIDNIQMQGELIFIINKYLNLYSSIYIDEWTPEWTFKKKNRNWFGYQVGLRIKNIFNIQDQLLMEYNWTDHRVYRHLFPINNSYSYDYPLGFWAGPHAEELYFKYNFSIFSFRLDSYLSLVKRGELTEEMLENQYNNISQKRFSGKKESRTHLAININKNILNEFVIFSFGVDYVDWINPGFNPAAQESIEKNISKFSFNLNLHFITDIIFH